MGAADELVGAVAAPADLPVQLGGGVSNDAVFGIEARLLAKAAADIADQHAHAVLRPLQNGFREQVPGRAGVCDCTCRINRPVFFSISAIVERGSIAEGTSRWLTRSSETLCAALANASSTLAASP